MDQLRDRSACRDFSDALATLGVDGPAGLDAVTQLAHPCRCEVRPHIRAPAGQKAAEASWEIAPKINAPFTIIVHHGAILRASRIFVMMQRIGKAAEHHENVPGCVRSSEADLGANALSLVYQAAEVFSDMEARAREIEARAQSMCKAAAERLLCAEQRSEAADRARRQIITEAECKLQDASRALRQAELRIATAEDRATAAEFRAQVAEANAREAVEALALVEDAIRKRFCAESPIGKNMNAAA